MRMPGDLLALFALIVSAAPAIAEPTPERATAFAAAFASWCLGSQPNFAAEDHKATAAGYGILEDRTIPLGGAEAMKQKNWLVPDPTGDFMLTSAEGSHNGVHIVGCGITANDAGGEAVALALSALPQLGPPRQRIDPAPSGGVTVWWDVRQQAGTPGSDTQVMLAFNVPGVPGAMVNLINRSPPPQSPASH